MSISQIWKRYEEFAAHYSNSLFMKKISGPKDKRDIVSIKDYFRMDTMLALKILLLQRKNPKKFNAIIEMESNEKNRLLTTNFK